MMYNDEKAFEVFLQGHMPKFLKVMWRTGAVKWYRNGTFFSAHMEWWHPLTWIFIVFVILAILPICLFTNGTIKMVGEELWELLTVDKYFKDNPDKIRWYK